MKAMLIIVVFLLMNAFFIISNNNLALKDEGSIGRVYDLYFSWVGGVMNNIVKISGEIVKLDWVAIENSTG